jgi:hypothetical protein
MLTLVLPSSEVAYVLRSLLGPIVAWDDCLADMRRGKTSIEGLRLVPACRYHDGLAWRPGYTKADILIFVAAVRAKRPDARPRIGLQAKTVELDPADMRFWKVKKVRVLTTPGTTAVPSAILAKAVPICHRHSQDNAAMWTRH